MANGVVIRGGKQSWVHVVVSSSSSLDENGQERFLHQGRCRTHCPRGLYPDRGHYACLPCIANCELCTDSNICAKCRERYKLQNGVCQTASCDIGKRRAFSVTFCVDDWKDWLSLCRTPVLLGQVQDPDTGECINCEMGCKTCSTGESVGEGESAPEILFHNDTILKIKPLLHTLSPLPES